MLVKHEFSAERMLAKKESFEHRQAENLSTEISLHV